MAVFSYLIDFANFFADEGIPEDRANPSTLFHSFGWRSIQIGPHDFAEAFKQLIHRGSLDRPIVFYSQTTMGQYAVKYKYGPQVINQPLVTNVFQANPQRASSAEAAAISASSSAGYKVTGHHGTEEDLSVLVQFNLQGMTVQVVNSRLSSFNTCAMFNSVTRRLGADQAIRFSDVVRAGKIGDLMDFVHLVHSKISELRLLTVGGNSIVHANIGDELWVPLTFLGEGASSLFTIALLTIGSENGIIFLDDFDSVVHHSLLDKVWRLIVILSRKFNVQVFATSHSQESLEAAVRGVEESGDLEKLMYYRLRRDKNSFIKNVAYSGVALKNNIMESWEVR